MVAAVFDRPAADKKKTLHAQGLLFVAAMAAIYFFKHQFYKW